MSKNFRFSFFHLRTVDTQNHSTSTTLSNQERSYCLKLRMNPESYLEKLYGIYDFYFIPESDKHYALNMIQTYIKESLHLIQSNPTICSTELKGKLTFFLQVMYLSTNTSAWNNNILIQEEINHLNDFIKKQSVDDNLLNTFTQTNLIHKRLTFATNEKEVISIEEINHEEFSSFEYITVYATRGYTPKDFLECSINLLVDFIQQSLKAEQSYTNSDIDYINGSTDNGVHRELIAMLKYYSTIIRYTINSTSWRGNELYPFDQMEIEGRSTFTINPALCTK